jgi:dTDP-glucose 4,6-dehydratase
MPNRLANDLDHVLAHTPDLWGALHGRRIFLTGGTGFFGCWLLESFCWANDRLKLGASAVVLTRNPEAFRAKCPHLAGHPAVCLHAGDVRSFAFPDGPFSHAIHAAASFGTRQDEEDPLAVFDTIADGTRHTLDFCRSRGIRELLMVSSGAVYGRPPAAVSGVPEGYAGAPDPFDPQSAYGEGKRAAELLCALYARQYGLLPRVARCFAFLGPYLALDGHFAVGNFIRDALAGGPVRIQGDGTPRRSYLYAADLAIWLWTILLRGRSGVPYHVGSTEHQSIQQIAEQVAACFQPHPAVWRACEPVPAQPVSVYVPDTARAAGELGLRVTVDLPDAIRRTIAWHRGLGGAVKRNEA